MKQKIIVNYTASIEVEVDVEPRKDWRDGDRWALDIIAAAKKETDKIPQGDFGRKILYSLAPYTITLPEPVSDTLYNTNLISVHEEDW